MDKRRSNSKAPPQRQRQQQNRFVDLKLLPPIDPSTIPTTPTTVTTSSSFSSCYSSQVKKEKSNARYAYMPRIVKPGPAPAAAAAAGTKPVKKFDHEANTKADLLADTNLGHNIIKTDQDAIADNDYDCSVKDINPSSTINTDAKVTETRNNTALHKKEDGPNSVSAKSQLHEVCAANNWERPLYECCNEEGPGYCKLFTYRVTIEIEELSTVLECLGGPRSKKQSAAEHAAEGALWYLKQMGYFPPTKFKQKKKK